MSDVEMPVFASSEQSAPLVDGIEDTSHHHEKDNTHKIRSAQAAGITSFQAAVSIAKAVMGAGSFSLPWAFARTGYVAGPLLLLGLSALSASSIKMLVTCRRFLGRGSYVDVAHAAFGDSGSKAAYFASISASVGVCGSYLVFISATLLSLVSVGVGQSVVVIGLLPFAVILSAVKDAHKFAFASLLGDISVLLGMLVVVIYGAITVGIHIPKTCVAVAPFEDMPLAFGAIGFLFFVHFLVLPIEGSMAHPQDFDRVVTLTLVGCALVSAAFGVAGYLFFGEDAEQIVILNVEGSGFVSSVKLLLCIDLLFTYPVVMRPSAEIVEHTLRLSAAPHGRLIVCTLLGMVAAGAGIFVPAFALLSGLVGGVSQTFLGFVLPPLMLYRLKQGITGDKVHDGTTVFRSALSIGTVLFGVFMIIWSVHSTWNEVHRVA